VGQTSSTHLPLCLACLKGLAFMFDGEIKDNRVWHAILDDLHTIMYMPIKPSESIKTFMTHGRNKIIESFTQHLHGDSWIWYFWTYYFQVGRWINSQSIIVVPPCCAYPKIFTSWIKVETPMMDLAILCGGKMQYLHDYLKMHIICGGKMQCPHYDFNPHYIW